SEPAPHRPHSSPNGPSSAYPQQASPAENPCVFTVVVNCNRVDPQCGHFIALSPPVCVGWAAAASALEGAAVSCWARPQRWQNALPSSNSLPQYLHCIVFLLYTIRIFLSDGILLAPHIYIRNISGGIVKRDRRGIFIRTETDGNIAALRWHQQVE